MMESVRIKIVDLYKCITTIDGEYLVIDDDKICKTLREARPKRQRGGNRQQHLEESDMPPAKRRCSPIPPRAPKPNPVKSNTNIQHTSAPTAGPVANEAKGDPEVDFVIRAVRAALERKKSKENVNPLVDEILSLD